MAELGRFGNAGYPKTGEEGAAVSVTQKGALGITPKNFLLKSLDATLVLETLAVPGCRIRPHARGS